jgi:hypothetical protein
LDMKLVLIMFIISIGVIGAVWLFYIRRP